MPLCRRLISGSNAACSPLAASVTTAINGSLPPAPAKAPYHAAHHCGCWNGVDGLMSFQRAAACFQSWTSSTRNLAARVFVRASSVTAWVIRTVIVWAVRLRRLRQVDDLAGLRGIEAEVDRTARAALALDPFAVAQQLLHYRLGEERRAAQIARLRRVAEAMAQHAIGEVDDLVTPDFFVGVGDGHRDAEGVEVLDPMRRVHLPAQHLAGADVEHLGMVVVPVLVGQIDFDVEQRDVFEMLLRDERRGVGVYIDALAAGDLHKALSRQVGVVIDLRVGRR